MKAIIIDAVQIEFDTDEPVRVIWLECCELQVLEGVLVAVIVVLRDLLLDVLLEVVLKRREDERGEDVHFEGYKTKKDFTVQFF